LPTRFRFKGTAYAAAGVITTPFREIIEVQAPATLSEIGGYSSSHAEKFRHRNVIRFESAHTEVTGSRTHFDKAGETYSTLVRSSVEGLDILGMVTADRVVANLVSTYNLAEDEEPSVKLIGSRFEGLRIAGIPIHVHLCVGTLDKHHRHKDLKKAYAQRDKNVCDLFGDDDLKREHAHAPEEVKNYLDAPPSAGADMPHSEGTSTISIVRKLEHFSDALKFYGYVIHVPGFGTVRLGEVRICKHTRSLTMIQVHLGCPFEGDLGITATADGGTSA
jgi:hypothetical protein